MPSPLNAKAICRGCEKEFDYCTYNRNGHYCSNKCQSDYQFRTITIPKILLGEVSWRTTLKRFLIHRDGEICVDCQNDGTWQGKPLSLQVDHINGDSDNNLPENLRLLCPNCHSQTPTWTGRRKKNSKRSQYMAEYRKQQGKRR